MENIREILNTSKEQILNKYIPEVTNKVMDVYELGVNTGVKIGEADMLAKVINYFNQFVDIFKYIRDKSANQIKTCKQKKSSSNITEKLVVIEDEKIQEAINLLLSTGQYKVMKLEKVEVISYKDEWKECTIKL